MNRTYLLTLILFVFSTNIYAHVETDPCAQETVKEKDECVLNMAEQLEIEMLISLSHIKKNHPEIFSKIEKNQRIWLNYRNSYCNKTIENNTEILNCIIKLTKERINLISHDFK